MPTTSKQLFRSLLFATKAVVKRVWEADELAGLTGPQFGVLRILEDRGPLTPSDLSEIMLVSAANITGLVTRLQKLGLIERRRQPSDRRSLKIALSRAGRKILRNLTPIWEKEVELCFRGLTSREKRELSALLDKFTRSFVPRQHLKSNVPHPTLRPGPCGVKGTLRPAGEKGKQIRKQRNPQEDST